MAKRQQNLETAAGRDRASSTSWSGRLEEASSAEVEMSLLERATELADEAGRLLEQVAER